MAEIKFEQNRIRAASPSFILCKADIVFSDVRRYGSSTAREAVRIDFMLDNDEGGFDEGGHRIASHEQVIRDKAIKILRSAISEMQKWKP